MNSIIIESGALNALPQLIGDRKFFAFADQNISKFLEIEHLPIKTNENFKSLKSIEELAEILQENGVDRNTVLIAIGGGTLLDTIGFLASIYMRGVQWIAVPSTLLAMADASIGGKTAVNTKDTKNLLGSFHEAECTIMDLNFIQSLPEEEFSNGMAEIIKHALISDPNYIDFLELKAKRIKEREPEYLKSMIERSVRIKLGIVAKDPKEQYARKLLNFGHTFGHAIEVATKHKIPHGFAVAKGIELMNKYAIEHFKSDPQIQVRTKNLFDLYGLNFDLPKKITMDELRKIAKRDKKIHSGAIDIVILRKIGQAEIIRDENFLL